MSEQDRIVDPRDLVAPAGPHDASVGSVRQKASGVVRFSARGRYAMYAILGLVVFGLAYGLGIFETNKALKNAGAASPQPHVSVAPAQAVAQPSNSTIEELAKQAPAGPQAASRGPLPHSLAAQNTSLVSQMVTPTPMPVPVVPPQTVPVMPPAETAYYPQTVPNAGAALTSLTRGSSTLFQPGAKHAGDDRRTRLIEAQRSGIFVGSGNESNALAAHQVSVGTATVPAVAQSAAPQQAGAAQRIAFANGNAARPPYLRTVQEEPVGKVELWAGSVIGAELDTGINTDLPGPVVAHVTRNVYDSKSGRVLVIPKGSRLIGRYNALVSNGQARVQVVWDRLIWPDGRYLSLLAQTSTDTTGNAGMYADVNDHRGGIIGATLLSGIFAAALDLLHPPTTGVVVNTNGQVVSSDVGTVVAQNGQKIVQQKMQVPPELTVPAGENFNVLLDRTILLSPWEYQQ